MPSRKDDYASAILAKWQWCWALALQHGCDLVVHGGDVFDVPRVPLQLQQQVEGVIYASPTMHAFVVGTHDVGKGIPTVIGKSIGGLGYNGRTRTTSGVEYNLVEWITRPKEPYTEEPQILLLSPYHEWMPHTPEGCPVICAHKMIVPEPVPWDHMLIRGIETDAQIVCSGDYHPGWPEPIFENETWWCNPGALARTFRSKEDLTRPVRCAIVDTDDLPKCPIEYIEVPHAPAEEVYNAEVRDEKAQREKLRASVSDAVSHASELQGGDWRERLSSMEGDGVELPEGAEFDDGLETLEELCEKEAGK